MSRYLIAQTHATEWIIDYSEERYYRRPLRERVDPPSVEDRLVSNTWHPYTSVKIMHGFVDDMEPESWLKIKTPDLGPEQRGIESGAIRRMCRTDDFDEIEWSGVD